MRNYSALSKRVASLEEQHSGSILSVERINAKAARHGLVTCTDAELTFVICKAIGIEPRYLTDEELERIAQGETL